MKPTNLVRSVEDIQDKWKAQGRSLGIMAPIIHRISAHAIPQADAVEYRERLESLEAQLSLDFGDPKRTVEPVKPLTPPEYEFKVRFSCPDERREKPHEFKILDWEVDALYFKIRHRSTAVEAKRDVLDKLNDILMDPSKDIRFFLGNISTRPWVFTIVGL